MLRYKMRLAIGLRNLLTKRRAWRSVGQERNKSMWSMSSRGRVVSKVWCLYMMMARASAMDCMQCHVGFAIVPRADLAVSYYHPITMKHRCARRVPVLAHRDGSATERGRYIPFPWPLPLVPNSHPRPRLSQSAGILALDDQLAKCYRAVASNAPVPSATTSGVVCWQKKDRGSAGERVHVPLSSLLVSLRFPLGSRSARVYD